MRTRHLLVILSCFFVLAPGVFSVSSAQARSPLSANFASNGDLIHGWYWLRDPQHEQYAFWRLNNVVVNPRGVLLSINALATGSVNGGRGVNGEFLLQYGTDPSVVEGSGGQMTYVRLRNVSGPNDPVGYTNTGSVRLAASALGPPNSSVTLYLRVERRSANGPHMAFNAQSMDVSAGGTQSAVINASDFYSNGDLIQTWYWLRDEALRHYATWTFDDVPVAPSGVKLTISELATDRMSGSGRVDGRFVLRYGTSPSVANGRGGRTINVRTHNASRPHDPVGYANSATLTLPASALGGAHRAARIYLRVERSDPRGPHVAFRAEAMQITVAGAR